eukprot:XP_001697327.1 predicted protein [Chlamydomonas reinhardtii]
MATPPRRSASAAHDLYVRAAWAADPVTLRFLRTRLALPWSRDGWELTAVMPQIPLCPVHQ